MSPKISLVPRGGKNKGSRHGSEEKQQLVRLAIPQISLLLQMEAKARIQIWKRLPLESLLPLRLTCLRIKTEIDHNVGLVLNIDDTKPSFDLLASKVGFQHLRIKRLGSERGKFTPFLLHPILLRKLEILGDISVKYASYLFESVQNLAFLSIHFSHHLLHHRISFFPVAQPFRGFSVGAFPTLTHLHVLAPVTSPADFTHMRDMLHSLFTQDLKWARIRRLEVTVRPAAGIQRVLKTFHTMLSEFVNHNAPTLITLHIDINQRLTKVSSSDLREVLEAHSSTSLYSIDTMTPSASALSVTKLLSNHVKEYVVPVSSWNGFPALHSAFISVNKFAFYWTGCLTGSSSMESLYLNLKIAENWNPYVVVVARSAETLQELQLHNVNRGNVGMGTYVRDNVIDLSIFGRCKELNRLTLVCKEDELMGSSYELKSIASLFQLRRLSLGWVGVSPCQLTRLLICAKSLTQLDLEYCSLSDSDFAAYFCRLRCVLGLACTRIRILSIVDHKIRFQGRRKAVDRFLKAQWRHTLYYEGYYHKVVYSHGIRNRSKGVHRNRAFPSSVMKAKDGGAEIPVTSGADADDKFM